MKKFPQLSDKNTDALLAEAVRLHRAGDLNAAEAIYHAILADHPEHAKTLSLLGTVYAQRERLEDGIRLLDKTLALKPDYAEAYYNRALSLQKMGRYREALDDYTRAFTLDPGYYEAGWHKSLLHLTLGEYEEGWKLYELRWKTNQYKIRTFRQPLWDGRSSLRNKTLFLHAEQGLGDAIQFCRYVPVVEVQDIKVILEVPDTLLPLMSTLKSACHLVGKGEVIPEFDMHCPLMSLPRAFNTSANTVPADVPYLSVSLQKRTIWQEMLGAKTKPRIGLMWAGSPVHRNDHNRTISLERLLPLLDARFEFHSLQKEIRHSDQALLARLGAISHAAHLKDFSDTAALVAEMDLIISVDTSVAHLAGALGKPVWILLPFVPDFRWMLEREDSPWYPSARLFRQRKSGDWEGVVQKVQTELEKLPCA